MKDKKEPAELKGCKNCWANNDGGLWCPEHPVELCKGDCEKCKKGDAK